MTLYVDEFAKIMTKKFEMSMMGELKFFLGFQVKQLQQGTFISQTKYTTYSRSLTWIKPSPSKLQ